MWASRWALVAVASAGCVHDQLVPCGDLVCPIGNQCDTERSICIDPLGLSVPPEQIAFTDVACGGSGQQVLAVKNFATTPISFSAVSTLDGIEVVPSSGVFPAGATVTLQLVGTAPARSIPGTPLQGQLLIATDGEVITRDVQLTTRGAVVAASVQQLDFGEGTVGVGDTRAFQLHNTGTAPILVAPTLPGPAGPSFTLVNPGSVSIGPGETRSVAIAFQPQALVSYASSVALAYAGAVCQPPPDQVSLSGVATTDEILVDHLTLDFGATSCDSPGGSLPLKVTNNLLTDQTLTSAITGTDPGVFSAFIPSVLPHGPGGALTVLVVNATLPTTTSVGPKTATLTLDAPGPPSSIKTINLTEQVNAPVLGSAEQYFDFGTVGKNSITSHQFVIANTGNALAMLQAMPSIVSLPGGGRLQTTLPTIQPHNMATVTITLFAGSVAIGVLDSGFTYTAKGMCSDPISVLIDLLIQ